MLGQGHPVSRESLDVRQRKVVLGILGEELESAREPHPRAPRIPQPLQVEASPLVGDGGPPLRTRRQVEAPLVELGGQHPVLLGEGVLEQAFDGGLAAGIFAESPAVDLLGASAVFEGSALETGQLHQRRRSVRTPQVRDRPLQRSRRGGSVADFLLGPRQAEQGGHVVRIALERALEQSRSLRCVAEPAVPDLAHLRGEGGLLDAAHRQLSLNLGDLEGELPPLLRCVDPSQLCERRLEGRVEADDVRVLLRRSVDLQAALLEHLGQPEGDPRPLFGVLLGVEVRRFESAFVEGDEVAPLAIHEVMFLEGLEGGGDRRIRLESGPQPLQVGIHRPSPLGSIDESRISHRRFDPAS